MKKIFSIILVCQVLCSCDPPKIINFSNPSTDRVSVILKVSEVSADYELNQLKKGDSICLIIEPDDEYAIHIGIGDWPDEEISRFSKNLKSIEFKTMAYRKIYDNQNSIKKLFKNSRSGFWFKNKIDLVVE